MLSKTLIRTKILRFETATANPFDIRLTVFNFSNRASTSWSAASFEYHSSAGSTRADKPGWNALAQKLLFHPVEEKQRGTEKWETRLLSHIRATLCCEDKNIAGGCWDAYETNNVSNASNRTWGPTLRRFRHNFIMEHIFLKIRGRKSEKSNYLKSPCKRTYSNPLNVDGSNPTFHTKSSSMRKHWWGRVSCARLRWTRVINARQFGITTAAKISSATPVMWEKSCETRPWPPFFANLSTKMHDPETSWHVYRFASNVNKG